MEIKYDIILEALREKDFTTSHENRLLKLENNEQKVFYYETITSTSGTITPPAGATLLANEFGESGNAILAKVDPNEKPIDESPRDSSGNVVTASLDINTGNYITSGAFTDPKVALIYAFKIKAKDFVNLDLNYVVGYEQLDYTAEEIKQKYESNPNTNAFTDAEKLKLQQAATLEYVYFSTLINC